MLMSTKDSKFNRDIYKKVLANKVEYYLETGKQLLALIVIELCQRIK